MEEFVHDSQRRSRLIPYHAGPEATRLTASALEAFWHTT
jgi:hypothetical protein